MKILFFIIALMAGISACFGQSTSFQYKQCSGENTKSWDRCIGTHTYPNGNIYSGQYINGERSGVGMIRIVAKGPTTTGNITSEIPSIFVGEFKNDRINGHGVWMTDNGQRYVGDFENNLLVKK